MIGGDTWTVWLRIDKEGRFPKTDDTVRPEASAVSRLSLAKVDAEFLLPRLDNLPGKQDDDSPVTLDLNGRVTLRAWGEDQPRPLELLLSNSSAGGEPASVRMNRHYLARALRLGLEQLLFFGPQTALQCHDDYRAYIWMPLDGQEAPRVAADPVRAESPVETTQVSIHRPRLKERKVTQTVPAAAAAPAAATKPRKRSSSTTAKTSFEQAIALRDTLQAAARLANELAREFKHQKRQARIVESTLASLKQLQKAAG